MIPVYEWTVIHILHFYLLPNGLTISFCHIIFMLSLYVYHALCFIFIYIYIMLLYMTGPHVQQPPTDESSCLDMLKKIAYVSENIAQNPEQ